MNKEQNTEEQELTQEELLENQSKIMDQLAKMQEAGLIGRKTDPLKDVEDINAEFKLVQEKKSRLSAMKRRMVCARHAYFQEVEERRLLSKELNNEEE